MHEVRLIPTKKDIAFVEYADEAGASVAKDALHNYKLDGENKIKVPSSQLLLLMHILTFAFPDNFCEKIICRRPSFSFFQLATGYYLYSSLVSRRSLGCPMWHYVLS